jgi:hypothetical protein
MESLTRGKCPVCQKIIMNKEKTELINGGISFFVKFSDESIGEFTICQECYSKITQEQLDEIMKGQIISWGLDIAMQLRWFYSKSAHYKIIQHAKTKNELTPDTK